MSFKDPLSVSDTQELLAAGDYVADEALATALFLSLSLKRPLFLEGEAGVGKTEIAKVLSKTLGRRLIRLQCYEGLDVNSAVYEWNYSKQMLHIRLVEGDQEREHEEISKDLFSEEFLIKRPLLQALEPDPNGAPILLIDELDRTDAPFEAFLLEVLSDYQITIPETGMISAVDVPIVLITSNRTREIHDALKRRCFYHWLDYPTAERELEILQIKAPEAPKALSSQIVSFVQKLRKMDLFKNPGVAETIDWAHSLIQLNHLALDHKAVDNTLGVLLKYQDDIGKIQGDQANALLSEIQAELGMGKAH